MLQGREPSRDDPNTIALDDTFQQRLRDADANGNPTLLLVDPWTLQLAAYGKHLNGYDDMDFANGAVLVCANDDDEETTKHRVALRHNTYKVLWHKWRAAPLGRFRDSIDSIDQFRRELIDALVSSRQQIISATPDPRPVAGPDFVRPQTLIAHTLPANDSLDAARRAEILGQPPIRQPRLQGPST